jgi:hypothetical protein
MNMERFKYFVLTLTLMLITVVTMSYGQVFTIKSAGENPESVSRQGTSLRYDAASISSIGAGVTALVTDAAAIEAELLSVGTAVDTIVSSSEAIDNNTAIISDSISNPLEWKVSVASVTSTVGTFTSQLTSDTRRFVAIKNRDAFKPVYLGFEDVVTVETGLPINDTLYIEAPKDVPLYFISAEEVGIILMEGGR